MSSYGSLVLFSLKIIVASSLLFSNDSSLYRENVCESKLCVFKCSPQKYAIYYDSSDDTYTMSEKNFTKELNFEEIPVHNKGRERLINKKIEVLLTNATEAMGMSHYFYLNTLVMDPSGLYLQEDGSLKMEIPNAYTRFDDFEKYEFCIDYLYTNDTGELEILWMVHDVADVEDLEDNSILITSSTLILSAILLGFVVIAYALLPRRSLTQFIVLGYATSQFCTFAALSAAQIVFYVKKNYGFEYDSMCKPTSVLIYFLHMSCFAWLNVMSFDIWWSVTSKRSSPVRRQFSKKTLFKYCAYAFGLPLVMSTAVAVMDNIDLSEYPYIIKPNFNVTDCFFVGGERFLYLYIPLIIILIINTIFLIKTALIERDVSKLLAHRDGNTTTHRNRYVLYVKLSTVMGLHWVLEVVNTFGTGEGIIVVDCFNILFTGLGNVFLLFVSHKEVIRKLSNRYPSMKKILPKSYHTSVQEDITKTSGIVATKTH